MRQKPHGGTAITAGVLAIVGGVWASISVLVSISELSTLHTGPLWPLYAVVGASAINVGLLIYGGIGLFLHQPAGRMCTIIGCGLAIVFSTFSVATSGIAFSGTRGSGSVLEAGIGVLVVVLLYGGVGLVLALVKPTADWVSYRPSSAEGPRAGA
ncbi:hypothetical protein GCM10009565_48310 [Amycolatopsis albidoflavus]